LFDCLVISSAETLERWNSGWTASPLWPWHRIPFFHEWRKYIRVRYHFIRGCLEEGNFKACYINTKDQLADLLTKPLGRIKFLELCSMIGIVQLSHKITHNN
jgi:hypothetical protein